MPVCQIISITVHEIKAMRCNTKQHKSNHSKAKSNQHQIKSVPLHPNISFCFSIRMGPNTAAKPTVVFVKNLFPKRLPHIVIGARGPCGFQLHVFSILEVIEDACGVRPPPPRYDICDLRLDLHVGGGRGTQNEVLQAS